MTLNTETPETTVYPRYDGNVSTLRVGSSIILERVIFACRQLW